MIPGKNIKRIILILSACITVLYLTGFKPPEKIRNVRVNDDPDSLKATALFRDASLSFEQGRSDTAFLLASQALLLATESGLENLQADNHLLMGLILRQTGEAEDILSHFIQAALLYEKTGNIKALSSVHQETGNYYFHMNAWERALHYYELALDPGLSVRQAMEICLIHHQAGLSAYNLGNFTKAESHFQSLLKLSTEHEFDDFIAPAYYRLASVYAATGRQETELKYYHDLYNYFENTGDVYGMILVMNNMGYSYFQAGHFSSASDAFLKSLDLAGDTGIPPSERIDLYTNIAVCQYQLKEPRNSIGYLHNGLLVARSEKMPGLQARLENMIALVYFHSGDLYNAGQYSLSSINSARQAEAWDLLSECYRTQSQVLKEGNDPINSLAYYEMYLSLRDSLLLEQRLNEQLQNERLLGLEKSERDLRLSIADEQMKDLALRQLLLEAERREQEIELFQRQRDLEQSERERVIQSLELSRQQQAARLQSQLIQNLEQEKAIQDLLLRQKEIEEQEREREIALLQSERERQQLEIEKQEEARKRVMWMLALSAVIIILVITGLLTTRRKNKILERQAEEIRTQTERIVHQKNLIEEKNRTITDSINYASRIQTAILPRESQLDKFFDDHFIFFRPKDIVSGDFYWMHSYNGRFMLAAVDCTGHGVPGAFVSMLGMAFLNEITGSRPEIFTDELLNELRKKVITSLHQSADTEGSKDGMDISLCMFDHKQNRLQYSGANNPVYHLREGMLSKIEADRMPIGIHSLDSKSFSRKEIELKKGDLIYMFSDGYPDQFGGPEGKKFKYKPFMEMISSIRHLDMQEQGSILAEKFEDWRGSHEQIDDVLVIGVRV